MFTGLVEALAEVVAITPQPPGVRLTLHLPTSNRRDQIGDSIAINGCCLTVVAIDTNQLSFEAGEETLSTILATLLPPNR